MTETTRYEQVGREAYQVWAAGANEPSWDDLNFEEQRRWIYVAEHARSLGARLDRAEAGLPPEEHSFIGDLKLKLADLPPLPDGHVRVMAVRAPMSRKAWNNFKFAVMATGVFKPDSTLMLLLSSGEDINVSDDDAKAFTVEGMVARIESLGMRDVCVVERDASKVVFGAAGVFHPDIMRHIFSDYRVDGLPVEFRRRNEPSSALDSDE